MSKQNVIRVTVLAGLLAWPGVELYRYSQAKQDLEASAERLQRMNLALASLRQSQPNLGAPESSEVLPVTHSAKP